MRLLFIGGTRFVGLAMAREALRRGHAVDVFHRSQSSPPGLEGARHFHGDRDADLSALREGTWDAVIDPSAYRPRQVECLLDALSGRFGQYVFISSISVYANETAPGSDETAARQPTGALTKEDLASAPITGETYGPLKVLCEDVVFARAPGALVIRPTYVIGPDDYTQRFGEWVRRIARGGEVIAPGPRESAIQYIDARDLADFVVGCVERKVSGTFNAAGAKPGFSFGDLLDGIAAGVAPPGTTLRWVTPEEAKASGLQFPMWQGGESSGLGAMDSSAAFARGLRSRPLPETARDVLGS